MDGASIARILPLRFGPSFSDSRSGWNLRQRLQPMRACSRNQADSHCPPLSVAEPVCGARDRLDPPGMPGPRDRLQRKPREKGSARLPTLLPPVPNASRARQGRAPTAPRRTADDGSNRGVPGSRWAPSPVLPASCVAFPRQCTPLPKRRSLSRAHDIQPHHVSLQSSCSNRRPISRINGHRSAPRHHRSALIEFLAGTTS